MNRRVLVCCNAVVREGYITGEALGRLERLAEWEWLQSEGTSTRPGVWGGPSEDPANAERLRAKLAEGFDALIVCHGAPYVDASVLDAAKEGKVLWSAEVGKTAGGFPGPRCTPSVADGRVVVLSSNGLLRRARASDAKVGSAFA